MNETLSYQVCTAILIKTKINRITVYECPICGQSSKPSAVIPAIPNLIGEGIHKIRFSSSKFHNG